MLTVRDLVKSYRSAQEQVAVARRERTVVIELDHEHYRRLVIEVASPPDVVKTLRSALAAAAPNERVC